MIHLITGGCGFLGSNLAAEVLRRGDELVVFDNLSRLGAAENLAWLRSKGDLRHIHGDIRSEHDIARAVAEVKPEAVFHLSGQVAMTTSLANPRLDFETNTRGTFNLLEAVRLHAPECMVLFSSTNKVYGDLEWLEYQETETRYLAKGYEQGFDESTPLDFRSPYGVSKGAADQYMLDYHRMFGLRTCVFRHSSMYGGRQYATYDQGWVGWFCQKALEIKKGLATEPFTISGNGKQVRDLLHADDMTALYFTALDRFEAMAGHAFNIGGGVENSLSLLELFRMLEQLLDIEMKPVKIPPRVSDQKVFIADIGKVRKSLGWTPKQGSLAGVKDMLAWSDSLV